MITQDITTVFDAGDDWPITTVIIPLYNYQNLIEETLNSLLPQSMREFGLVVVNDCSTDHSEAVTLRWMEQFHERFSRCILARNIENAKLAITRNTGIDISASQYLFFLDADNILFPNCLERHVEALATTPAADASYSLIQKFEGASEIMGNEVFHRDRFKYGNHVDAMSMIRRSALMKLGGFYDIKFGWEDYDLWLRMCENKMFAVQIPEILSKYRVHQNSMLRSLTNISENNLKLKKDITKRHNWLKL